jgi:hypothetical protein
MARIVNFFDAAQSETTPTIGSLVASNLINYPNDAAYEGGEPSGAINGSIYYSTDLDAVRVFIDDSEGGAWQTIVVQADIDAILARIDDLEENALLKDGSIELAGNLLPEENRSVSLGAGLTQEYASIHSASFNSDINQTYAYLYTDDGLAEFTMSGDNGSVFEISVDNTKTNIKVDGPLNVLGQPKNDDNSSSVTLKTGDVVAGDGNSGNIFIETGVKSGTGTRGTIKLKNGSEGTVGHVWTSTDTDGGGSWQAPTGGGAEALSDLTDVDTTGATNGQVLTYNSGDNEWQPADPTGGSGTGSKNYFDSDSADIETSIGSWETDDGSGGPADYLTLDVDTATPLAGAGSLEVIKSANDATGEFVKAALLPIDRADRGKILFGSVQYDATDANYSSNDLKLEAWDVTGSPVQLYMGPNAVTLLQQQGKIDFVVYTELTTEDIEFRIVVNSTNATAYTVYFDEFRLGPAASVSAVYRNQVELNLAGSGGFTTGKLLVSRVGGIVSVSATQDSTFTSASTITSATGFFPAWATPSRSASTVVRFSSGGVIEFQVLSTGAFQVQIRNWSGALLNATLHDLGTLSYTVPDTSSQTLTTNELGVQTGLFRASRNGSDQTGINPNNTAVKLSFNSTSAGLDYVRGLTYDTTNSRFVNTGPSGYFSLEAAATFLATNVLNNRYEIRFAVNGNAVSRATSTVPPAATIFTVQGTTEVFLNTNDFIEPQLFGAGNNSSSTLTMSGAATQSYFSGRRIPDFTVLGAVRERNKVQTKILASNVTTNGTISSLTFSNLVIGKWYECTIQARLHVNEGATDIRAQIFANHNSVNIASVDYQNRQTSSTAGDVLVAGAAFKFKAETTTLVFDAASASANSFIAGNNTRAQTFVQLEERNDLIETTEW